VQPAGQPVAAPRPAALAKPAPALAVVAKSAPTAEPAAAPVAEPAPAPTESVAAAPSEGESPSREVPLACSGSDGCFPDPGFTERLCRGKFPSVSLAMFAKAAPWKHLFVQAVSVEPINVHGGPRSESMMSFGEEVVVLRRRGPGSGKSVQISGPTDLDVLRWDGTCATIREELFVTYNQGVVTAPHIVWKYLDDSVQEGLRKNAAVDHAMARERKSCRDSSPTKRTPDCDKAMKKLTDTIVLAVRSGLDVPKPETTPEWRSALPTASR
jgi:hypothetical protein